MEYRQEGVETTTYMCALRCVYCGWLGKTFLVGIVIFLMSGYSIMALKMIVCAGKENVTKSRFSIAAAIIRLTQAVRE